MKYSKKPIEIVATEFQGGLAVDEIREILGYKGNQSMKVTDEKFTVTTEWGDMECEPGDMICFNGKNVYTCNKHAFVASYRKTNKRNVYVKLPVKIDAVQWNGQSEDDIMSELQCEKDKDHFVEIDGDIIKVKTIDNPVPMEYKKGTWIVKGVMGELYGVAPDEFKKLFTVAESATFTSLIEQYLAN